MGEVSKTEQEELSDVPKYAHDCDHCVFLGHHSDVDMYFCEQDNYNPTVTARISDDPADYVSGLDFIPAIPALVEAKKRARALGLINYH